MGTTGEPGRPPVLVGPPVGDFNAAMIAAQAILLDKAAVRKHVVRAAEEPAGVVDDAAESVSRAPATTCNDRSFWTMLG